MTTRIMANVPQLNADTIILSATVWMKSDIESEIDYLENVLKSHYCDVIIARWEKLTGQKAIKL